MIFQSKENYGISDLLEIMVLLRSKDGCPWDREQTHTSIRKNLIEEAYEVADAIDLNDPDLLQEELGDLLLQVVFHSRISEEAGGFDINNVADQICKKLIIRHPHIFADVIANNSQEVLDNWDEIKKREKGQTTASETLHSVPKVLPALMRSQKVQKRAGKAGLDYEDISQAIGDLESEIKEVKEAIASGNKSRYKEELGDLLFSAVNVSRLLKVDAEEAITEACNKFINRFEKVENLAVKGGVDMKGAPMNVLNKLWDEVKTSESSEVK